MNSTVTWCCRKLLDEIDNGHYSWLINKDHEVRLLVHEFEVPDCWYIKDNCPFCKSTFEKFRIEINSEL
jgi:hypothetical protein